MPTLGPSTITNFNLQIEMPDLKRKASSNSAETVTYCYLNSIIDLRLIRYIGSPREVLQSEKGNSGNENSNASDH